MKTDWKQNFPQDELYIYNVGGEYELDPHKVQNFIQSLLDQQREEIHTDMLKTCENWHGTGVAMINDYFNKIKDK